MKTNPKIKTGDKRKKLTLPKETLRDLTVSAKAKGVRGGGQTGATCRPDRAGNCAPGVATDYCGG